MQSCALLLVNIFLISFANKALGKEASVHINQIYKISWPVILAPLTYHQSPPANLEMCSKSKWNINITNVCTLVVAFPLTVFLLLHLGHTCLQSTDLSILWDLLLKISKDNRQRDYIHGSWASTPLYLMDFSYPQCFFLLKFCLLI